MPATYCYNCSEKIVYDLFKPKVCPHCNQSPAATISLSKKESKRPTYDAKNLYNDDAEEEQYQNVPHLSRLQARIFIDNNSNKETLGGIVNKEIDKIGSQANSPKGRGRPKKLKPTKEITRTHSDHGKSFDDFMNDGRSEAKGINID